LDLWTFGPLDLWTFGPLDLKTNKIDLNQYFNLRNVHIQHASILLLLQGRYDAKKDHLRW